jgi:hypothetical protein
MDDSSDSFAKSRLTKYMEQIVIHKISPDEIGSIQTFIETLGPFYSESDISQMKKDAETQEGYVAVDGKTILGFVLHAKSSDNIGKIIWLGIPLGNMEHSTAPILLKRLEREYQKKLIQRIQVVTKSDNVISEMDLILRQFYRGYGFSDKENKANYFSDGSEGLILEKNIF